MLRATMVLVLALAADLLAAPAPAEVLFERMKGLAGDWEGKSTKGWTDRVQIDVIAGGSVVRMRSFEAHPGETMETMVSLDGDRVLLTHYCVARNQPRLVATKIGADGRSAVFEFLDGTGMASRDTGHMDKVVFELPDDDRYTARWTWYQKGEERWLENIEHRRVR